MKKLFLLFTINVFIFASLLAQTKPTEVYIKNGKFHTVFTNGLGVEIPVTFNIDDSTVFKLTQSDMFKQWDIETFSDTVANKEMIQFFNKNPHIEIFLYNQCLASQWMTTLYLKNKESFTPITESNGLIFFTSGNELCITWSYKAQNEYGNMIFSKAYRVIVWNGNKIVTKDF